MALFLFWRVCLLFVLPVLCGARSLVPVWEPPCCSRTQVREAAASVSAAPRSVDSIKKAVSTVASPPCRCRLCVLRVSFLRQSSPVSACRCTLHPRVRQYNQRLMVAQKMGFCRSWSHAQKKTFFLTPAQPQVQSRERCCSHRRRLWRHAVAAPTGSPPVDGLLLAVRCGMAAARRESCLSAHPCRRRPAVT